MNVSRGEALALLSRFPKESGRLQADRVEGEREEAIRIFPVSMLHVYFEATPARSTPMREREIGVPRGPSTY